MTNEDSVATTPMVPTAQEEDRFWALVEEAWSRLGPEPAAVRRALCERDPGDDGAGFDHEAINAWLHSFLDALGDLSSELPAQDLVALDRVVERKLYDLDRADVHHVTDGSDDGFLYARGFIVAMGREFYEAVDANPAMAGLDIDCEGLCYLFAHLHNDRFGEWPRTGSGISRESFGNAAGWRSS